MTLYNVLVSGVKDGEDLEKVLISASSLFKKDVAELREIFVLNGVVVKKSIDEKTANIYIESLRNIGCNAYSEAIISSDNIDIKIEDSIKLSGSDDISSASEDASKITTDLPDTNESFCTKCGTKIFRQDLFCKKCGTKTGRSSTDALNDLGNNFLGKVKDLGRMAAEEGVKIGNIANAKANEYAPVLREKINTISNELKDKAKSFSEDKTEATGGTDNKSEENPAKVKTTRSKKSNSDLVNQIIGGVVIVAIFYACTRDGDSGGGSSGDSCANSINLASCMTSANVGMNSRDWKAISHLDRNGNSEITSRKKGDQCIVTVKVSGTIDGDSYSKKISCPVMW